MSKPDKCPVPGCDKDGVQWGWCWGHAEGGSASGEDLVNFANAMRAEFRAMLDDALSARGADSAANAVIRTLAEASAPPGPAPATALPWDDLRVGAEGDGSARSYEAQLCNSDGEAVFIIVHDGSREALMNVSTMRYCVNTYKPLLGRLSEVADGVAAVHDTLLIAANGLNAAQRMECREPCGVCAGCEERAAQEGSADG